MELHELVERIERWKKRQAGIEESEPAHASVRSAAPAKMAVPIAVAATGPSHVTPPPMEMGEVTDEYEVEPVTGVDIARPGPEAVAPSVDYPPENSLESLPDDADEDMSGSLSLSEFEEIK